MGFTGDGTYACESNPDNSLSWIKLPNPPPVPKNLGPKATVTTDYVSGWEHFLQSMTGLNRQVLPTMHMANWQLV